MEKKLNEDLFQRLIEYASIAVVAVDESGKIMVVNKETERMFKYKRVELLGQKVEVLIPPKIREAHKTHRSKYTKDPQNRTMGIGMNLSGVKKDGAEFPIEVALSHVEFNGSRMVLSFISDITKRKIIEDELENSNKELKDFIYIASHDLQEPLRKVQGFGDRLKVKYKDILDEKGIDYLTRMQNASQRMQVLIEDLLAYSRITTKERMFEKINLNEVITGVLSDLEYAVEKTNGKVIVEQLPEIEADGLQMRQLFQNLISNALKFHKEEESPRVIISAKIYTPDAPAKRFFDRTEMCQLTIEDNGIGIEKEYQEKVFEVFERLHSRSKYEGTGIGLAIVRRIVDKHNGSIRIESEYNVGTKFIINLPTSQIGKDL